MCHIRKLFGRLNKRQTEEIGTLKSPTKPLYTANKNKEELEKKKRELEELTKSEYDIEKRICDLKNEIREEEETLKILREMDYFYTEVKVEEEKIKIHTNSKNELEKEKGNLQKELNQIRPARVKGRSSSMLYFIPLLFLIASVVLFEIDKKRMCFAMIIASILCVLGFLIKNIGETKELEKEQKKVEDEKRIIDTKINVLDEKILEQSSYILKLKNTLDLKLKMKKEELRTKYPFAEDKLFENIESKECIIEEQNYINDLRIKLSQKEIEKNKLQENLAKLLEVEEKLNTIKEILEELEFYNETIEIAKEAMENAYIEMKESVTPKFSKDLSRIISNITNGKYRNVKIDEDNNIILEADNRKLCVYI